jgi:hypothetical protein
MRRDVRRPIPYHDGYEIGADGVVYGKTGKALKIHSNGKVRLDTGFHDPVELWELTFAGEHDAEEETAPEEAVAPAPPAPPTPSKPTPPRSALKESVVLARQRGLTDEDIADALGVQVVTIKSLFV